jgi:DNA-directed RNA polymerase subunit RPC12/RpoP
MRDLHMDIRCRNCGHKTRIRVKEMIPGRSKRCSGCGTTLQFSGDDGRRVQRSLDDLEPQLKRLSRKITIKL